MSSSFCALEEAFTGPALMQPGDKKKKQRSKDRQFEQYVPVALPSQPDPDRPAALAPTPSPMMGAPSQAVLARLESTDSAAASQFFPLPGESADSEEWQKAFTLEGSATPGPYPQPMANGAIPVAGRSTLWRDIPQPAVAAGTALSPMAIPGEISARLDQLTRQLESLTGPAPMQTTAELFLFVAIGLLLLLALDTLLRFATSMNAPKRMRGGGAPLPRMRWPSGRRVWVQ
jgi:hypothetical protein